MNDYKLILCVLPGAVVTKMLCMVSYLLTPWLPKAQILRTQARVKTEKNCSLQEDDYFSLSLNPHVFIKVSRQGSQEVF